MKSSSDAALSAYRQSTTGAIAVTDDANKPLGIVTLHDLLRAQLGVAECEG